MYRGISELKGLIIDIDSFRDVNITDWEEINQKYKCLFIVVNEEQKKAFQASSNNHHHLDYHL